MSRDFEVVLPVWQIFHDCKQEWRGHWFQADVGANPWSDLEGMTFHHL